MGRKKKKNNDLQKTGIISLLVIIGALGYINLINGNISLPEAKIEPNINITSTPFYQKMLGNVNFGMKNLTNLLPSRPRGTDGE